MPQHRNWGEFKVPSLRNVSLTAPYMHAGSHTTLADVARHYSELDENRLHADGERLLKPLHSPLRSPILSPFSKRSRRISARNSRHELLRTHSSISFAGHKIIIKQRVKRHPDWHGYPWSGICNSCSAVCVAGSMTLLNDETRPSLGHNGGPPLTRTALPTIGRTYCWRRAHKAAWKHAAARNCAAPPEARRGTRDDLQGIHRDHPRSRCASVSVAPVTPEY